MVKKKINKYHLLQIDQIKRSFVNFSYSDNKTVLKIFKSSLGMLSIIRDFFNCYLSNIHKNYYTSKKSTKFLLYIH